MLNAQGRLGSSRFFLITFIPETFGSVLGTNKIIKIKKWTDTKSGLIFSGNKTKSYTPVYVSLSQQKACKVHLGADSIVWCPLHCVPGLAPPHRWAGRVSEAVLRDVLQLGAGVGWTNVTFSLSFQFVSFV